MNVFLDDIRNPNMSHNYNHGLGTDYDWVIITDYFEFVKFIKSNFDEIELISFDHDLACYNNNGVEFTGKDAADFLVNFCLDNHKKFPNWYVHSDNTPGKANIIGTILNYLRVIEYIDTSTFRYYNCGLINNRPV